MIHVIAEIELNAGARDEYLRLFKAHVLNVRQEKGCVAYGPTVDAPSPIVSHPPRPNVVTIVEQWASLADLAAHGQSAHQMAYRKQVAGLVAKARVEVFQDA